MNQFTSNPGRELLVIRPHAVEDGMTAVLAVRDRKTVVVDLSGMDSSQAQRTADFLSGGVEALDGGLHRLADQVFLFTPAGIQVTLN